MFASQVPPNSNIIESRLPANMRWWSERWLGWQREQVTLIDEDLGLSGASTAKCTGFARRTAEVALGHAGIVLGLEVSRVARNNADWYRLLDFVE